MSKTKTIIEFLSGARSLHYIMPLVIIYLIIGTVAQKYVGLYEATQTYFYAPIIWLGYVPLPGFSTLLAFIFISLCANLIFKGLWSLRNSGIILTHMSVMLLIGGGFVTGFFAQEGYLDFAEGQSKSAFHDYHSRELVLLDDKGQSVAYLAFDELQVKGGEAFAPENAFQFAGFDFNIEILNKCRNCEIKAREEFWEKNNYRSMAAHMQLFDKKPEMNNEENMGGVLLRLTGLENEEETGIHVVLEDVPKRPLVTIGDKVYQIALRKKLRELPFTIQLIDFEKSVYPGTQMAKEYQSRVRLQDGDSLWESVISMNEPLRYKGYSFYQSSFIQTAEGQISVLAVVKNSGRSFPYIASVAICIGLILHLILRRRFGDRRKEKSGGAA
jgi:hypothetical protein